MVKIGLIGVGFMGGTHAACYEELQNMSDVKVTAIADKDINKAKKIAKKFDAQVFETGKELIEKANINAVDICLPTYLHTEHALLAMEKGYDVFIEKPVCLKESEAISLLKMKEKTKVNVMVGHCIRFWPEYKYLKNIIENKTYGNINSAVFNRLSPRPDWAWENWLHDINKSGLAPLDLHIHDVDFVRYILGNPKSLEAFLVGSKEQIFSLYKYYDIVVSIEGGWNFPVEFPFEMGYRVKFEEAVVIFSSTQTPTVKVYRNNGTELYPEMDNDFSTQDEDSGGNISSLGAYFSELKYFVECLINRKSIEIAPLEEGVESFRLTMRELEAAKRGNC